MASDTFINEQVSVWAFFDPSAASSHIFPIAMNWRRRLVKFQKLILSTTKRVGDAKILNLICASDTACFELEYNSDSHLWRLVKVMSQE
ncbi:hypothetical protein HYU92_04050 [Candidatus Curtissbacteria bacterium]|nr:hypothetical protein [Candidatus Curtissbacteria bacterium]